MTLKTHGVPAFLRTRLHADRFSRRRMLGGVGNQVGEDMPELIDGDSDRRQVTGYLHIQLRPGDGNQIARLVHRLAHQLRREVSMAFRSRRHRFPAWRGRAGC